MKRKFSKIITMFIMAFVLMAAPLNAGAASNQTTIYNYLTGSFGLNSAAACGILANIKAESNFSSTASSRTGKSYGLCQWTGGRKSSLYSYLKRNGYSKSSIKGQLKFMISEMKSTGVWGKVANVKNTAAGAYKSGYNFCYYFERPANKASKSAKRGSAAKNTYWPAYRGKSSSKKSLTGTISIDEDSDPTSSTALSNAKVTAYVTNNSAFNTTKVKKIKVNKTYYLPYFVKTSRKEYWNDVYGTKYSFKVRVTITNPKGKVIKDKTFITDDHRSCYVLPTIKGTYKWKVKVTGTIKKTITGKVTAE